MADRYQKEDASGYILLEDGTSYLEMDVPPGASGSPRIPFATSHMLAATRHRRRLVAAVFAGATLLSASQSDGIKLGDGPPAGAVSSSASNTDGIKLGDGPPTGFVTLVGVSNTDGIKLGDGPPTGFVTLVGTSSTDGINLGDGPPTGFVTLVGTSDTDGVNLGDTPSGFVTLVGTSDTDGVVLGDEITTGLLYPASLTDGITLGDEATTEEAVGAGAANARLTTFWDSYRAFQHRWRGTAATQATTGDQTASESDGVVLGDTATAILTRMVASETDGLVLGDTASVPAEVVVGSVRPPTTFWQTYRTFAHRRGFTTTAIIAGGDLTASESDGIKLGENILTVLTVDDGPDGIKLGDNATAVLSASLTDGIKLGDSPAGNWLVSQSDGIKLGENILTVWTVDDGPDGIKLGDSGTAEIRVITGSIRPRTSFWDVYRTFAHRRRQVAATLPASFAVSQSDGIKLGETLATGLFYPASLSDGLVVGDSPTGVVGVFASETDGVVLGDSETEALTYPATDGIELGDDLTGQIMVDLASLSDGLKLGDTVVAVGGKATGSGGLGRIGDKDLEAIERLLYQRGRVKAIQSKMVAWGTGSIRNPSTAKAAAPSRLPVPAVAASPTEIIGNVVAEQYSLEVTVRGLVSFGPDDELAATIAALDDPLTEWLRKELGLT